MPAKYVRPYSKGQKNDFRDAEAIAEAVLPATRDNTRNSHSYFVRALVTPRFRRR
jgi:transposase